MTIGDRIKIIRIYRELSQSKLCALAHVASGMVSLYEQGKCLYPEDKTVHKLAAALEVTVDMLYGDVPIPDYMLAAQPPEKREKAPLPELHPEYVRGLCVVSMSCGKSSTRHFRMDEEAAAEEWAASEMKIGFEEVCVVKRFVRK